MKGVEAKIYVDANVSPKLCKARKVPFALRHKVNQESEHLERLGVIELVSFSE